MDNERKWINKGDLNFVAYGGVLVRPHWTEEELAQCSDGGASIKDMYDAFSLRTDASEDGDQLSAALFCIDINDVTKEDLDEILYICGYEEYKTFSREDIISKMGVENLVKEVVEVLGGGHNDNPISYHMQYPSSWEDFILTEEELYDWLRSMGAEEFIP